MPMFGPFGRKAPSVDQVEQDLTMKVTLERAALLKALGHVHRVVERRNTIPILSNVLVQASGSSLFLRATDLDLEVTETLAADVAQRVARLR